MEQSKWATVVLFISICIFAMSSWIGINGLWVELPKFVHELPEGWNLPSYLVIIIQVANIAPLAYLLLKKWKPNQIKEWVSACVIITVGIIASFLLIFTWTKTSYIAEKLHSTAILVLSFFLSMVDCASSVIFLPYMARFKSAIFMTALYVGEGFSGLVPSLIGLAQTMRTETIRFSVSTYFVILTVLLVASLASFLYLNFHPWFNIFKYDQASSSEENQAIEEQEDSNRQNWSSAESLDLERGNVEQNNEEAAVSSAIRFGSTLTTALSQNKTLSKNDLHKCIVLYVIVAWMYSLTSGILPSVQSYSCLPYGSLTYDLTLKLSILANPLATFCTLFYRVKRLSLLSILASIGSLMAIYHIYLAALSPNPILKDGVAGMVLAILSNIILSSCFAYTKVCISTVFSELGAENLLLYNGVIQQLGSLLGAIVGFLLVNIFHVFHKD